MVWLHPALLIALLALAGPVAVHLLRRQQARRLVVPSVRFIEAADRSAVRLQRISDPLLLLIRAAIIACAVLALARPLLLTDRRIAAWNARTARAVIIDSSESARSAPTTGIVDAEVSGASPVETLETDDLGVGVRRAAGWLSASPPVRREIVVVSDFQRGAIDAATIADLPPAIGIRFVRTTNAPVPRALGPIALLDNGGSLTIASEIDGTRTRLAYARRPSEWRGFQILGSSTGDNPTGSLLRVVERAGAFAPDAAQPITIRFDASRPPSPSDLAAGDWTFGAAQRFLRATSHLASSMEVSSSHGSLVVRAQADPGSLGAAQILKAALDSRLPVAHFEESEPERIDDATLARWTREPAAPDVTQWRQSDESDGRWLWVAALLLLALESYLRRPFARESPEVMHHAA
jgi:hypothetical protein